MKIQNVIHSYQVPPAAKNQPASKVGRASGPALDVQISNFGKDFSHALEALKKTPEVRTERVSQIQKEIQEGAYQVDSRKLALSMLTRTPRQDRP